MPRAWSLNVCRVAVFTAMVRPAGLFLSDDDEGLADLVSETMIRNRDKWCRFGWGNPAAIDDDGLAWPFSCSAVAGDIDHQHRGEFTLDDDGLAHAVIPYEGPRSYTARFVNPPGYPVG